ncbi:hypothetical protein Csa_023982, partial [Cucumis sativus]
DGGDVEGNGGDLRSNETEELRSEIGLTEERQRRCGRRDYKDEGGVRELRRRKHRRRCSVQGKARGELHDNVRIRFSCDNV